jgi:hypothetical protein
LQQGAAEVQNSGPVSAHAAENPASRHILLRLEFKWETDKLLYQNGEAFHARR